VNCKSSLHARHVVDGPLRGLCVGFVNNVIGLTDRMLGLHPIAVDAPCDHALGTKLLERNTRRLLGAPRVRPDRADHGHDVERGGARLWFGTRSAAQWHGLHAHQLRTRRPRPVECDDPQSAQGPRRLQTRLHPPDGPGRSKDQDRAHRARAGGHQDTTLSGRVWTGHEAGADLADGKTNRQAVRRRRRRVLFADDKLLAGLRRGNSLRFLDTRGGVDASTSSPSHVPGVVTEMLRTAYITNGTTLSRPGPGRHSA